MEELMTINQKELKRIKVLNQLIDKRLRQSDAAKELGISDRQVRKILKHYKQDGDAGIISKHRGKPSNHQLSIGLKGKALELICQYYPDFKPTFAHEKLTEEHGLKLSVSTVRNIMITNQIWTPKKPRKAVVHQMRERRAREGELVQIDGSPHDWFEGRAPKCTLLVYIDDATGKLFQLYFAESESMQSYFEATQQYVAKHGCPLAFYSDRHGVFKVNAKEALSGDGLTQFGRAMKELDIKIICANSPQAKGRVEKVNGTLQDRLVKELRLRNISSIDEANAFLPLYMEMFNKRFERAPRDPLNAHRKIKDFHNLDEIFSLRFTRTLSKDLILQYSNVLYQITTDRPSYAMRKAKVQILETMKGEVVIKYKGKTLSYTIFHQQERQSKIADSKVVNLEVDRLIDKKQYKPAKNHPWKKAFF